MDPDHTRWNQPGRAQGRSLQPENPSFPTQLELKDIKSLFYYLYPDEWFELQLKYTVNCRLQGHDKLNAKLDKGELIRFWGYCLAVSVHTGTPLEKMWSEVLSPESVLPPPNLGRHGMCHNRFKKIRSVLSFGPSDEATLRQDPWAFVRCLVQIALTNIAVVMLRQAGFLPPMKV